MPYPDTREQAAADWLMMEPEGMDEEIDNPFPNGFPSTLYGRDPSERPGAL
jgi:hypothetical protein